MTPLSQVEWPQLVTRRVAPVLGGSGGPHFLTSERASAPSVDPHVFKLPVVRP